MRVARRQHGKVVARLTMTGFGGSAQPALGSDGIDGKGQDRDTFLVPATVERIVFIPISELAGLEAARQIVLRGSEPALGRVLEQRRRARVIPRHARTAHEESDEQAHGHDIVLLDAPLEPRHDFLVSRRRSRLAKGAGRVARPVPPEASQTVQSPAALFEHRQMEIMWQPSTTRRT